MTELFEKGKDGEVRSGAGGVKPEEEAPVEAEETTVLAVEEMPQYPAMSASEFEIMISEAEKKDPLVKRMFGVLAKIAYTGDWTKFGDKGWLGGPGAERVAFRLGIRIDFDAYEQPAKEICLDEKGEFYRHKRLAAVSYMGRSIKAEGYSSSRKKFYSMAYGKDRPLSEINEEYIIADAKTSCIQEGVTRLLGLRAIPAEELKNYGIELKDAQEVKFKSGSKSKSKPYNSKDLAQNSGLINASAQKVIQNALEINEVDGLDLIDHLKKTYKGIEDIDQITTEQFNEVLSWIKAQGKGNKK